MHSPSLLQCRWVSCADVLSPGCLGWGDMCNAGLWVLFGRDVAGAGGTFCPPSGPNHRLEVPYPQCSWLFFCSLPPLLSLPHPHLHLLVVSCVRSGHVTPRLQPLFHFIHDQRCVHECLLTSFLKKKKALIWSVPGFPVWMVSSGAISSYHHEMNFFTKALEVLPLTLWSCLSRWSSPCKTSGTQVGCESDVRIHWGWASVLRAFAFLETLREIQIRMQNPSFKAHGSTLGHVGGSPRQSWRPQWEMAAPTCSTGQPFHQQETSCLSDGMYNGSI